MESNAFVPLETYPNLMLAELDKSRLSEGGVEAKVFDGNMGSFYSDAVGGIRLMVESRDLETARALLRAEPLDAGETFDPASEITADSKYCFHCHSKNIRVETVPEKPGILGRLLGKREGAKKIQHCADCGKTQPA